MYVSSAPSAAVSRLTAFVASIRGANNSVAIVTTPGW